MVSRGKQGGLEVRVLLHKSYVSINLHSCVSSPVKKSLRRHYIITRPLIFSRSDSQQLMAYFWNSLKSWPAGSFMEESLEWAEVEEVIQPTCLANGPAARGSAVNNSTWFVDLSLSWQCHQGKSLPQLDAYKPRAYVLFKWEVSGLFQINQWRAHSLAHVTIIVA